MKKYAALLIVLLLLLCSCSTFEDTPETDAAFAAYEAAVAQSIEHRTGEMTVVSETRDTVLENGDSTGVIEYSYVTDEEDRVSFERNDYTNGELVASYYGDGAAAFQMNFETGEWVDVTESTEGLLDHNRNNLNTLSLFRIDHNFRYSKRFLETVTLEDTEEGQIVTFTLKNSAVSDILSYTDEPGLKRDMAGQSRTYYINKEGNLTRIVIDTVQNVTLKGVSGTISQVITVHINY